MPLPEFQMGVPSGDVPAPLRRFMGAWAYELAGAPGKGRNLMLIVTGVDKEGRADGYYSWGPPTPTTFPQNAPGSFRVAGTITADTLRFSSPKGDTSFAFTLMSDNRLSHLWSHTSGRNWSAIFNPVWTLASAERAAKR